ncbi:MAG: hypothetical protein Q7R52_01355 [archaeon]|nr:hypothetical protein [archaeon]
MEQVQILEQKENPLFKRKEIKVIVKSPSTPSFVESSKFISEKFSAPEDNITVKKIQGKFGRGTFLIEANIYSSKSEKDKIEPKPKEKKK